MLDKLQTDEANFIALFSWHLIGRFLMWLLTKMNFNYHRKQLCGLLVNSFYFWLNNFSSYFQRQENHRMLCENYLHA
jgi:hypothetical protein